MLARLSRFGNGYLCPLRQDCSPQRTPKTRRVIIIWYIRFIRGKYFWDYKQIPRANNRRSEWQKDTLFGFLYAHHGEHGGHRGLILSGTSASSAESNSWMTSRFLVPKTGARNDDRICCLGLCMLTTGNTEKISTVSGASASSVESI